MIYTCVSLEPAYVLLVWYLSSENLSVQTEEITKVCVHVDSKW